MSDAPNGGPTGAPSGGPTGAPGGGPTGTPGGGPGAGQILVGIFLILFGLCVTLLGGGCTIMWVYVLFSEGGAFGGGILLFLVSLAVLAGGLVTIWAGTKMFRGN